MARIKTVWSVTLTFRDGMRKRHKVQTPSAIDAVKTAANRSRVAAAAAKQVPGKIVRITLIRRLQ